MMTMLIVPGLDNSGPAHWQSWLEARLAGARRVEQTNWSSPDLPAWSSRVRAAIHRAPGRVLLIAHSFGCLAAAQAGWDCSRRVAAALLVAPADPDRFGLSEALPEDELPFPAILVASRNDRWMAFADAATWADTWRADLVDAGHAGHINVESGHGPWPDAIDLVKRLHRKVCVRAESDDHLPSWHLGAHAHT